MERVTDRNKGRWEEDGQRERDSVMDRRVDGRDMGREGD